MIQALESLTAHTAKVVWLVSFHFCARWSHSSFGAHTTYILLSINECKREMSTLFGVGKSLESYDLADALKSDGSEKCVARMESR